MGRVIGDGGTVFQIVDIAVLKSYQGQGYGSQIMEHIMKYIKNVAVESTYVSLIADYRRINCMQNLDLCLRTRFRRYVYQILKMKNRTDKHTEFSTQLNLVCFCFHK